MSAPVKLVGFAAVLALVFGGAAFAGDTFGPAPDTDRGAATHQAESTNANPGTHGGGHGSSDTASEAAEVGSHPVRGLAVAENGLRLVVAPSELRQDARQRIRYRVVDEAGQVVRDFDVAHEKRMHLILARRDLTGFQHLHPEQQEDGSWAVDARLPDAGSYRLFADFTRDDEPYTLAADLRVDGRANLVDLPDPEPLADAGNGYAVRSEADTVRAGEPAELRFTPQRDGETVHVEPYLGAGGHLVALREGDLAFLHVHPTEHADNEGDAHDDAVGFEATFPTPGRYRLFLQFKHEGAIHTAAFTQEVE